MSIPMTKDDHFSPSKLANAWSREGWTELGGFPWYMGFPKSGAFVVFSSRPKWWCDPLWHNRKRWTELYTAGLEKLTSLFYDEQEAALNRGGVWWYWNLSCNSERLAHSWMKRSFSEIRIRFQPKGVAGWTHRFHSEKRGETAFSRTRSIWWNQIALLFSALEMGNDPIADIFLQWIGEKPPSWWESLDEHLRYSILFAGDLNFA